MSGDRFARIATKREVMQDSARIAIVSPVRDEIANLPRLYKALEEQSHRIAIWVICQNGSIDGTIEYLASTPKPSTVDRLVVINVDTKGGGYALGFTYSRIVNEGFSFLLQQNDTSFDYIGILDADCFPHSEYYDRIIEEFSNRGELGILSGMLVDDKHRQLPRTKGFPRGNCRVWRRACFEDSGYIIGMSADALSAIKAQARGWKVGSIDAAIVETRDIGARAGQEYYGESSYYRGETISFATLKTVKLVVRSPSKGFRYAKGYFTSLFLRKPKVKDAEIISFSRKKLSAKAFRH
jgi:glycosyltransferase involved in cell wall biosynthesis